MSAKVVRLGDGTLLAVDMDSMAVVDGHLLAWRGYGSRGDCVDAAWAPGAWVAFWEEPEKNWLERQRARFAALTKLVEVEPDEIQRQLMEIYLAEIKQTIENAEKMTTPQHGETA